MTGIYIMFEMILPTIITMWSCENDKMQENGEPRKSSQKVGCMDDGNVSRGRLLHAIIAKHNEAPWC